MIRDMRITGVPYVQGVNAYADQDGRKYGIAIHNTSNDAAAEAEASYATRRTDRVSAHLYCDHDSVIQSLDTDSKAGHAGSSTGNENAVAVEITGFNHWSRDYWLTHVAWDKLGAALAQVCRRYGVAVRRASVAEMVANPKVRAFYGHDDMRRAWGGTTHTDPGPNFPWDRLFAAVNAALGNGDTSTGDDDMSYNDIQKADAVFNNAPTAPLDTDGTIDGSGSIVRFPNKTYVAIAELATEVKRLAAIVGVGGGSGGGLTADEVRAIVREEIANADVVPGPLGPVL